jgi:hypothetical protein
MAIIPDTKDWTWVLTHPCPECGFDAGLILFDDIPSVLGINASLWSPVLRRADVRDRPNDHTWSALEYAAHVRDVYRIFTVRLRLMLDEDNPLFSNWDQDATAEAERYNEQDPAVVERELTEAATTLADDYSTVAVDARERLGRRSDGSTFTVTSLGRYLVHDVVHHLHDVGNPQTLDAPAGAGPGS